MEFVAQLAEPLRQRDLVAEERVIPAGDTLLKATLNFPHGARGVVALLHASSGGRFAAETRFVSEVLGQAGFATLEVDLLTPDETAALSITRRTEQHLPLLSSRVGAVVDWLENQRETLGLEVGLFASTMETIPALMAAERNGRVAAVVSRGGYPDFGQDVVGELRAPTLLLVGHDEQSRAAELASEFFARRLASPSERRRS